MTQVAHVRDDVVEVVAETTARPAVGEQAIELIERGIAGRIGASRFDLWFQRKTRVSIESSAVRIAVANGFAANWIRGKFAGDIAAAAAEVLCRRVDVIVEVDPTLQGDEAPEALSEQAEAAPMRRSEAGGAGAYNHGVINPRHTLEDFVVGPSNQMAYHAAMQVAQTPGSQFNPLFIHGHCGMGKTHLLQGICQRFARLHPGKKWLYLTGEAFTNEFLEAIRQHKTDAFRRRIRGAELLIIDDVHFLANKKATQEEFLHTFNQVDALGRQIVLSSDCAPRAIASMSESLLSRFVSGMVVRIDAPDLATRLEILRRRAARNQWAVSDAVLMHIAQTGNGSVRELEGLLVQVVAGMTLISGGVDTGKVMADLKDRTAMQGPVPTGRIIAAVAEHFGVETAAMLGAGREKTVAMARAVAMHLARQHTGMSYPEIGRALGGKNHSTVMAACTRVKTIVASGELVCWTHKADGAARHQAMADILHDLEMVIRRRGISADAR